MPLKAVPLAGLTLCPETVAMRPTACVECVLHFEETSKLRTRKIRNPSSRMFLAAF